MDTTHKRVLIVSAVFPPEPVTSAILNFDLANALARQGYSVTVITPKPSRPKGFDFSQVKPVSFKFKHIVVDSAVRPMSSYIGRMYESISFGRKCVNYIIKNSADIDFVYNDGWQLLGLYLVAKVCVKYQIPYIVPIQDIYPESLLTKLPHSHLLSSTINAILLPLDKYYIKHAAKIRTISESMADYIAVSRNVNRENIITVANWQHDEEFDDYKTEFRKTGHTVFMFVGNNNKQANVELLIRGFVKANLLDAELRIMGRGNEKGFCEDLVKSLNINNVLFESVPDGKVAEIQKDADVMVLALKKSTGTQGLPSKLTAYMFSGKPIIGSLDVECDAAKIIEKSQAGLVVPPDDIDSLSKAFLKMNSVSNVELQFMGNNSRKYAEEKLLRKNNLNNVCVAISKTINEKLCSKID